MLALLDLPRVGCRNITRYVNDDIAIVPGCLRQSCDSNGTKLAGDGVKYCPEGRFCASSSTERACPAGFYCPEGTVDPVPCGIDFARSVLQRCPEGSAAQPRAYYGVIVALFGLWLPLTAALEWLFVRVAQRRTDMKRKLKKTIQECVPRHSHSQSLR